MAAGLGTRMRSAVPKHLHPLLGRRLVEWVIDAAEGAGADPLVVVTSPDAREAFAGRRVAVQEEPRGTGDAVRAARSQLDGFEGDVLALGEVNSGIYVFRAAKLWPALERLESHNAQGELYVTDTLGFLVGDGDAVAVHVASDPFEVEGINTRAELAAAAAGLRDRINERHMVAGVTIVDPATTWIEPDVEIENDVTIHPFVYLRGATRVATGAEIHAHTVAVDAEIGSGAVVGPFCYLRPGTVLEADSKAGTFVEIKNSRIGPGSK